MFTIVDAIKSVLNSTPAERTAPASTPDFCEHGVRSIQPCAMCLDGATCCEHGAEQHERVTLTICKGCRDFHRLRDAHEYDGRSRPSTASSDERLTDEEIAELDARINAGIRHNDGRCGCEDQGDCWSQQAAGLAAGWHALSILQKHRSVPASEGPHIPICLGPEPHQWTGQGVNVHCAAHRSSIDVKAAAERIVENLSAYLMEPVSPHIVTIIRDGMDWRFLSLFDTRGAAQRIVARIECYEWDAHDDETARIAIVNTIADELSKIVNGE